MIPKIEMRMNIADTASKRHVVHTTVGLLSPVWLPLHHFPVLFSTSLFRAQ